MLLFAYHKIDYEMFLHLFVEFFCLHMKLNINSSDSENHETRMQLDGKLPKVEE